MVLGLKPMRKQITLDKYPSVRQNQGPCMVLGLKPMGKLITFDNYLSVRQNQVLYGHQTQTYGKTNNF